MKDEMEKIAKDEEQGRKLMDARDIKKELYDHDIDHEAHVWKKKKYLRDME